MTESDPSGNLNFDGSKGVGSDVTIHFDAKKLTGGIDVNGNRNRPLKIGIGHEFNHTLHMFKGEGDDSSSGKQDPEHPTNLLSKEELRSRQEENDLRNEHNWPARILPK